MLGGLIHGLPEIFSEISFYRLPEELIYTDFILLSLFEGITADVPPVQIQRTGTVAQLRYADRI